MTKHLTPEAKQYRDELASYYLDISNKTIDYSNQSSDQLSNLLVTISLAYVGLTMAVFNEPSNAQSLSFFQRFYVLFGDIFFLISILFGVIRWMANIYFLNKTHRATSAIHDKLTEAQNASDIRTIQENDIMKLRQDKQRRNLIIPIAIQLATFGIGMIASLFYIGSVVSNY